MQQQIMSNVAATDGIQHTSMARKGLLETLIVPTQSNATAHATESRLRFFGSAQGQQYTFPQNLTGRDQLAPGGQDMSNWMLSMPQIVTPV